MRLQISLLCLLQLSVGAMCKQILRPQVHANIALHCCACNHFLVEGCRRSGIPHRACPWGRKQLTHVGEEWGQAKGPTTWLIFTRSNLFCNSFWFFFLIMSAGESSWFMWRTITLQLNIKERNKPSTDIRMDVCSTWCYKWDCRGLDLSQIKQRCLPFPQMKKHNSQYCPRKH